MPHRSTSSCRFPTPLMTSSYSAYATLLLPLATSKDPVQCRVLDVLARSCKLLATPLSDGKPPRGTRQGLPTRAFQPASCSLRLCLARRAGVSRNQTHRMIDLTSSIHHLSFGEEAKTCTPFSRTPLRALLSGQRRGHCQRNQANRSRRLALYSQRPVQTYHTRIYRVLRCLTDTQAKRGVPPTTA